MTWDSGKEARAVSFALPTCKMGAHRPACLVPSTLSQPSLPPAHTQAVLGSGARAERDRVLQEEPMVG